MGFNEADTRAKLIDPALHARGWTEDLIRREETAGAVEIIDGIARRRGKGRVDYVLRVRVNAESQPIALALVEAKAEHRPPTHGLEQAKLYMTCKRLHVPFVYSSNGHLFVEFDKLTGQTSRPHPLSEFPAPSELRTRYEDGTGVRLSKEPAKPFLTRYVGGEASRRYYQDAAIRAVLEKIARGEKRALLSLATGAGKTKIAVLLLRKIADAGQLRRALFVCDRDELRSQALAAFQDQFGADAAPVSGGDPQKNARILIATYQTLDVDRDESEGTFLNEHYPVDYFSHIVIDECHRSAWGKWSEVLRRNPEAVQIGLTATPRRIEFGEKTPATETDEQICADNIRHFGEPAYEYDMSQGIEDGYLAACEIVRRDIFLEESPRPERETGIDPDHLTGKVIKDRDTGQPLSVREARPHYDATTFEDKIVLPDRVAAMCRDLFERLLATGGPEQKTIIFCARDAHADAVAIEMNNLYADWSAKHGKPRQDPYAFKCTAESGGSDYLQDLRGAARRYFVATTVDLLTTGVDVPCVRNVVFFKYVRSPIAFYQMVGRGTRIDAPTGKLMFRVYDYTDATRLFGEAFRSKFAPPRDRAAKPTGEAEGPRERTILVEGFDVQVTDAGKYIVTSEEGKAMPVTVEEYKQRLAAKVVEEAPTLAGFRERWVSPADRREMLGRLPDGGRSALLVRAIEEMGAYDLYDVLAELAYGLSPRTRPERADAFRYKHEEWLAKLPPETGATLRALAAQFARGGTDGLESPQVFQTPEVERAGGLAALKALGKPAEILRETKERLFAA